MTTSARSTGLIDCSSPEPCARISVTPTRNEAWIIDKFIAASKQWATHVIVADQSSTDGTFEKLSTTPGVDVIINKNPQYDEDHRQKLLLSRAREIGEKRILIGLDADEALSANAAGSPEWDLINAAAPGTVLRFRWVNILPGFKTAWICPGHVPLGFVDDGANHEGKTIHSPRVPHPVNAPIIDLHDIVVLHFQYVLWERMRSKQRWYQAWEHLKHKKKSPLDIYRQYNHMNGGWKPEEIVPVKPEWFESYYRAGIDFSTLRCEPITWWDREIVQMLITHGSSHFRRIAIWDQDWNEIAAKLGYHESDLSDPRSRSERIAHRLLAVTQSSRKSIKVRTLERLLRMSGW